MPKEEGEEHEPSQEEKEDGKEDQKEDGKEEQEGKDDKDIEKKEGEESEVESEEGAVLEEQQIDTETRFLTHVMISLVFLSFLILLAVFIVKKLTVKKSVKPRRIYGNIRSEPIEFSFS